MQSSSARLFGAFALAACTLAALPLPIAPDAIAQSLPVSSPVLSLTSSVVAEAQTLPATSTITVATTSTPVQQVAQTKPAVKATTKSPAATTYPRLVVPSINLNDPIVPVGLTSGGAMAVPSGSTSNVGWYDGGPQPGQVGSAVLDAHVFAAFKALDQLKTGDSIYVEMSATQTLRFIVTNTVDYPLAQITSQDLFTSTTNRDLNLITCAGQLTPDHSTYDHRLVIYSTLEN